MASKRSTAPDEAEVSVPVDHHDLEALTPDQFLEVTSQVPHGACVVATWDARRDPVAAVLSGFTPLSDQRPSVLLVLPEDEAVIAEIETQGGCSVALLSEGQDAVVAALSGSAPPVEATAWRVTPSGFPVLDGVTCWLECRVRQLHRISGAVVVVADATQVGLAENQRPLLHYQGGYGQFVPGQLSSHGPVSRAATQRVVELAGEAIEVLARDLGVECSVIAFQDEDAVAMAVANHSASARQTRLGSRIPVVPPLGIHFAANPGSGISEEEWLGRLGDVPEEELALVRAQLDRVRKRGWSIMLSGPLSVSELDDLVGAYSEAADSPDRASALVGAIRSMAASHEPEVIDAEATYDVLSMSVPIRSQSGAALAVLRLLGLPSHVRGSELLLWLSMLQDAARSVEALLEPRPITSRHTIT